MTACLIHGRAKAHPVWFGRLWLPAVFVSGLLMLANARPAGATALGIAMRHTINAGLGSVPPGIDLSTPARTWRSFLTHAAQGRFLAAAHCLDLTEVPTNQQSVVGARVAKQLYRVLEAAHATPGSVTVDEPAGPMADGEPTNVVVAYRFNMRGVQGEVWLRRTQDAAHHPPVWLFTRRTVASVGDWYRWIVERQRVETAVVDPGLGPAPAHLERGSPRDAVVGFLDACGKRHFDEAAFYLDLGAVPAPKQKQVGRREARRFKIVLDKKLWINVEALSNDPGGAPEAGLPDDEERVGSIPLHHRKIPILLHRSIEPDGQIVWTFSRSTVASIDPLYEAYGYGWMGDHLPAFFFTVTLASVQLWQWCGILLLLFVGWIIERIVSRPLMAALRRAARATKTQWDDELVMALEGPLRMGILAAILFVTVPFLDLSGAASETATVLWKLLGVVFLGWLLSRWVEIGSRFLEASAVTERNEMARSFIPIFSRMTKVLVWGLAVVVALDSAGIHVMGLIAGLGIGGMAVAFAAKDSIENVFGSVTIAADTPFKIGHFIKIGDITGTVERVGLRSTRVRTMDRTVVTVPNARLISEIVEDYSARDSFKFETTIGLVYGTSRAQLLFVIGEVTKMLESHPSVLDESLRVRLAAFGPSSIDIHVLAWVEAQDYAAFTGIAEELNFAIMDIIERSGSSFAFPSQTIYLAKDEGLDPDRAQAIEAEMTGGHDEPATPLDEPGRE